MDNRTISNEQFHNMTLEDMISSIHFCEGVYTSEESTLIVGHMIKICTRLIEYFGLDKDEVVKKVPDEEWDETMTERMKERSFRLFPSTKSPKELLSELDFIQFTEEIRREKEKGRCSV